MWTSLAVGSARGARAAAPMKVRDRHQSIDDMRDVRLGPALISHICVMLHSLCVVLLREGMLWRQRELLRLLLTTPNPTNAHDVAICVRSSGSARLCCQKADCNVLAALERDRRAEETPAQCVCFNNGNTMPTL